MPRALVIGLGGLLVAGAASAHHGSGTFDLTKDLTLTGVVTKMDFVNPHSWLYLEVPDANGQKVDWRCEMRAATVLRRSGWSQEMFAPGQRITITGSPARNDARSCYLSTVTLADGTSMNRYGQRERAEPIVQPERELRLASGELNISGDWAPEQLVMTDPTGREGMLVPLSTADELAPGAVAEEQIPIASARAEAAAVRQRPDPVELTPAGRAAAAGFDPRSPDDNPRMRCETTSIVFDWTFDGPINRVTQNGDTITLQYGQLGFTRTIHMNATHPATLEPSRGGHSIGRWDNDVLVVDSVGFLPGLLTGSVLHSAALHVVERFSFDPERVAITRAYTADDSLYFASQLVGSDTVLVADVPYSPDPCTELAFVDYEAEVGADASAAPAPAKPWWKFWD